MVPDITILIGQVPNGALQDKSLFYKIAGWIVQPLLDKVR